MTTFGEDKWDSQLFCRKRRFQHQRLLRLQQVKLKEEYHVIMIIWLPKQISWQLWLIGWQLVTLTIDSTVVINTMVLKDQ